MVFASRADVVKGRIMLKIKGDVPLINLIDMEFKCITIYYSYDGKHDKVSYQRLYENKLVFIDSEDRTIKYFDNDKFRGIQIPAIYDHCIRDLVQRGYVEDVKN